MSSVPARAAIGSIVILLLASGIAGAGDIDINASVDRTEITLGESIELTISVAGPVRHIDKPELPDLSKFDVYSSGTSSNISIVPGAINYQTDYSYILMPRKTGTYTIQPARVKYKGKRYSTTPIIIKVTRQAQAKQAVPSKSQSNAKTSQRSQTTSDFFIEQDVDTKKPYIGQQVTMIFRFYQAKNLYEQPTLQWPDYNGFWVEDLPPQKTYNKMINGKTYRVTEIRKALFATVAGKITIEPVVLTIPPSARNSFFDFDPFSMHSRRKQRSSSKNVLRSKKIIIDVQSLPMANKPSDFSGAVGSYSWKISIDKDTVEVDQPITLKASVTGSGNIKKLPGVEIPELENFRLYDSGSNENISKKNYKVSGSKLFEWVLIPTAPGEYELPELSFNFFDPWSKKYKKQSKKPGKVYVKPSSVSLMALGDRPVNVIPAARTSLNYIATELSSKSISTPFFKSKLVWIVQLMPVLWLIFLTVHINRRKRLEGDIAYARRKLASKAAKKALKEAYNGLKKPELFYSLVFNGIVGFISDKLNVKAAGLTNTQIIEMLKSTGKCDSIIDEFSSFLDKCDIGRFSPNRPTSEQAQQIYNKAENLLSELDRNLK